VYDFIFIIIELFSLALTGRCYRRKSVDVNGFWREWVTSIAHFRWKETSPTNHFGWQKTRRIALSCGIKILLVGSLDLSQSTLVTGGRKGGQNYDSQDCASKTALRGKNVFDWISHISVSAIYMLFNKFTWYCFISTMRCYASVAYAVALWGSVCPSQASIVPKRLNLASPKQCRMIAQQF